MRLGYIDFLYGFGLSYKFYKYMTLSETEKPHPKTRLSANLKLLNEKSVKNSEATMIHIILDVHQNVKN